MKRESAKRQNNAQLRRWRLPFLKDWETVEFQEVDELGKSDTLVSKKENQRSHILPMIKTPMSNGETTHDTLRMCMTAVLGQVTEM